ncbi:hypothetical protein GCM10010236_41080 [Streptomyces eurythermus]|nr:hypothetical protein GCM10010236_41080 [Streptomyces eurythermus]
MRFRYCGRRLDRLPGRAGVGFRFPGRAGVGFRFPGRAGVGFRFPGRPLGWSPGRAGVRSRSRSPGRPTLRSRSPG